MTTREKIQIAVLMTGTILILLVWALKVAQSVGAL